MAFYIYLHVAKRPFLVTTWPLIERALTCSLFNLALSERTIWPYLKVYFFLPNRYFLVFSVSNSKGQS